MNVMRNRQSGFTIVELLIVIVVIAILAAISIVAYNGIQNRANDSAVQNDIGNLVKTVRLYEADNGSLPIAGSKSTAVNSTVFPGITFKPSKGSYDATVDNLMYCSGNKSGTFTFAITARSKSNKTYIYRPDGNFTTITAANPYNECMSGFDAGTNGYSYGYFAANGTWYAWTN